MVGPDGLAADRVFDSSVLGIAKPDPRLFHAAFDKLGVSATKVAHIGDSMNDDVEGAISAGASAVHMQPFGRCDVAGHADIVQLSDIGLLKGTER